MKKTDQPQQPRAKLAARPKNLPPLTPEEQAKRGQTLKDLTSFPPNQAAMKTQKPSSKVLLPKLDQQLKPRNSAKDASKENEQLSMSSTLTGSASKSRPLKKKDDWASRTWTCDTSYSSSQTESQESSFSADPEGNQVGINITKALKSQKQLGEVEKFLDECGLPQYANAFKEHGFDDLETIMEIRVNHLVDMKIPSEHQAPITRRIDQLQNSISNYLKSGDSNTSKINIDQIKSHREGYYSQMLPTQIQRAEPDKDEAIGSSQSEKRLLDGAFNEEESHASFLEALNEWRSSKKTEHVKIEPVKPEQPEPAKRSVRRVKSREPPKRVKIIDPKNQEEEEEDVDYISFKGKSEKKPFFFTGGAEWNKVDLQKETGTDMSPRGRRGKPKVSCWNCYQIAKDETSHKIRDKIFCSQDCVKAFNEQNLVRCSKEGCNKEFMKGQGILSEGSWYCGESCGNGMEAFELSLNVNPRNVMSMADLEEKYSHHHMVESG